MTNNDSNYVRCVQNNNVYMIPKDVFAKVVLEANVQSKRYVRYKTGAALFDMSERKFADIAKESGAVRKINQMTVVDIEIFKNYIDTFAI